MINQATSAADIDLGATKVNLAQKNLDALPVWTLGYYPQTQLQQAEQEIDAAREKYQESRDFSDQRMALAQWQQAIDLFALIPEATIAGHTARVKLKSYDRDFKQLYR